MDSLPLVSVVIPTYQRCLSVSRTLQALTAQTMAASQFEVVVSIDGSRDGTREMVAAFRAPYGLRAHWQSNRGRAAACNRAVEIASGGLIVLLDDDMEPVPDFLSAHLAAHQQGRLRAVMGAAPIVAEGLTTVSAYVRHKFNGHLERLAAPGHLFVLRDFYSGNLSIDRRVFLESGGFDEAFVQYGNEDLELWYRLRARGVELVFSKEAIAHQRYTKDFTALARDNIAKGRTAVLLVSKHPAAASHLKLGAPAHGRWLKRAVLRALLSITRAWPRTTDAIIAAVGVLSRTNAPWRMKLLGLTLDYCYFVGAADAKQRDGRTPGRWAPIR